jgi:hypothetical protein
MKNLLIYLSPNKCFSKECETLAKIQIENSIELGWKKEDILLVTNFDYKYMGVKSEVVEDDNYCALRPRSINSIIIPHLIEKGIIKDSFIYWVHDFDVYQMNYFSEDILGLEEFDVGLTDYGWKENWCMGSFFVKKGCKEIFIELKKIVEKNIEDEKAMMQITSKSWVMNRCKRMNITYDFGMRNIVSNYGKAEKPLKVLHFHPYYRWVKTLDIFMYGKNELQMPLMDKRLIKLFNKYDIR